MAGTGTPRKRSVRACSDVSPENQSKAEPPTKETRVEAAKKKTSRPASPVRKVSDGSGETLKRSPEAILSLNTRKSSEEIWAEVVPFTRLSKSADFDAASMYKLITWNVAGLRGMLKKDSEALTTFMDSEKPDILCLQETKLNVDDAKQNAQLGQVPGYIFVDHPCAMKKGYSGTRTYMRASSMVSELHARCTRGFTLPGSEDPAPSSGTEVLVEGEGDDEGRVLTTFLSPTATRDEDTLLGGPRMALVNTYVANSGMGLARLPYRVQTFDPLMRDYLQKLDAWSRESCFSTPNKSRGPSPATDGAAKEKKASVKEPAHGVIWTGDLNVAERDFDRYYAGTYKTMQECSGFTPEERSSFRETLASAGLVDSFRHLYPNAGPAYTFWSMRINGRAKGLGWRLDYFAVSTSLMPYVVDCFPMPEVTKSDHCPVQLWMRRP